MKRPKRMRVRLDGTLGAHVSAKDIALRLIADLGVAGARGFAVEYTGSAIAAMPIEQRMTLCNLNIEMGGRSGFVAPDDSTFAWLEGRPYVPQGDMWDRALAHWRTLTTDDGAEFDREVTLDCGALEPQITWGTDPSQVVGISGKVPRLRRLTRAGVRLPRAPLAIWGLRRVRRLRAFRCIASLSAPAPIAGCPISKLPRRS